MLSAHSAIRITCLMSHEARSLKRMNTLSFKNWGLKRKLSKRGLNRVDRAKTQNGIDRLLKKVHQFVKAIQTLCSKFKNCFQNFSGRKLENRLCTIIINEKINKCSSFHRFYFRYKCDLNISCRNICTYNVVCSI